MKLQEFTASRPEKHVSKVFESYFDSRISFDNLSLNQSRRMLQRVRGLLQEHKKSADHHYSEHDSAYLKLVMMETALSAKVKEEMSGMPSAGSVNPVASTLASAVKKSQMGKSLTNDEQKTLAQAAVQKENRLRWARRMISEGEVQQAQVVLAAQDMVDNLQNMIEDSTEMQYKELPALVDSIRNQVGLDQANKFNADATAALSGLVQNLQGTKQQLETALNVVTGQETPMDLGGGEMPGMPGEVPGGLPGEEEVGAEMDLSVEPETDLEEPKTSARNLGRSRR